jgi:hypothetical protein
MLLFYTFMQSWQAKLSTETQEYTYAKSLSLKDRLDQIDFNWCVKWYLQAYQVFEMTYFFCDETF